MSGKASICVWEIDQDKLTSSELLVLLALANRTSGEDNSCWPSQATIAKETRLSERTVRACMLSLTRGGFITRQPEYGFKGRTTDKIFLNFIPAEIAAKPFQNRLRKAATIAANARQNLQSVPATIAGEPKREPKKNLSAQGRSPLISGDLGTLEEQRAAILADPLNKANWKTDG